MSNPQSRSKNIVVCSDGTGNTAIKGRGTNVFKLFEAVDVNGHRANASLRRQVAFYDDGVGTQKLKWLRIVCGAFGIGLSRNVGQLYAEIARVYQPLDDIYLFGFSRGAFTVRTLAGMIATCGIVNGDQCRTEADLRRAVRRAYLAYRSKYDAWLTKALRWLRPAYGPDSFRSEFVVHDSAEHGGPVTIRFIGVWDTVDAVGLPFGLADVWNRVIWRFKFNDLKLSGIVTDACQALALDEERAEFKPLLWNESEPSTRTRIEQVWFAGAHSNVGGGYPQQGMSLVALDWMIEKATAADLRFVSPASMQYHAQHSVADKLYDPRSGFGVFYRWKPRDVSMLCKQCGISTPTVHISALERIAQGVAGYAPGNIPASCNVVATEETAAVDLLAVSAALQAVHNGSGALTKATDSWVRIGMVSYVVFIGGIAGAVAFAAPDLWTEMNSHLTAATVADAIEGMLTLVTALPVDLATAMLNNPVARRVLEAGLVIGYLLSAWSDKRIERLYSSFWHDGRRILRQSLSRSATVAASGTQDVV